MSSPLSERTRQLYTTIALPYNEAFPEHSHPEHRQLFINRLPRGARVLDAACAGGRDTAFFHSSHLVPTGIDFSHGEIEYAKSKYPGLDFREVDLLELPDIFPRSEFDGIYSYATLDHLRKSDIPKVISNFNSILKRGGILLVCTRRGKGVLWTNDSYSLNKKRRFTLIEEEELQRLLVGYGFDIEYIEVFQSKTRRNMEFILTLCRKEADIEAR